MFKGQSGNNNNKKITLYVASVIYLFYLVPSSWPGQLEKPKINQSEQLTAARLKKEKAHYKNTTVQPAHTED